MHVVMPACRAISQRLACARFFHAVPTSSHHTFWRMLAPRVPTWAGDSSSMQQGSFRRVCMQMADSAWTGLWPVDPLHARPGVHAILPLATHARHAGCIGDDRMHEGHAAGDVHAADKGHAAGHADACSSTAEQASLEVLQAHGGHLNEEQGGVHMPSHAPHHPHHAPGTPTRPLHATVGDPVVQHQGMHGPVEGVHGISSVASVDYCAMVCVHMHVHARGPAPRFPHSTGYVCTVTHCESLKGRTCSLASCMVLWLAHLLWRRAAPAIHKEPTIHTTS